MFKFFGRKPVRPRSAQLLEQRLKAARAGGSRKAVICDEWLWSIFGLLDKIARSAGRGPSPAAIVSKYYTDGTAFELACYLAFRIDHFYHEQGWSDEGDLLVPELQRRLLTAFEPVFPLQELRVAIDSRIGLFGEMVRKGKPVATFLARVEEFVFDTNENGCPSPATAGDDVLTVRNAFEAMAVKSLLRAIEEGLLPTTFNMCRELHTELTEAFRKAQKSGAHGMRNEPA